MICDSCGTTYEPAKHSAWCPHMGAVGLVGPSIVPATDNYLLVGVAVNALNERLRMAFAEISPAKFESGAELEHARATPFRCWFDRKEYSGPGGEMQGMGFALLVAIPPDSHAAAHAIIESLPDQLNSFDVYATPWPEG